MSCEENMLKEVLRPYLNKALASYETFLAKENWSDAKEFNAYHSACKAVLGHISLLVKLTQGNDTTPIDTDLSEWLKKAKKASAELEDLNVNFD
ncbi:MAG: hypothetical protein IKV03_04165 [Alphaproteobacteria bacterium]|nr:hypothetical protein [Alphaproteobacteria bacterium]